MKKTFILSYKITKGIREYLDCYDFYWIVWDNESQRKIDKFTFTLIFPKDISGEDKIWIHQFSKGKDIVLGNKLYLEKTNVGPREDIVIRALITDKNYFYHTKYTERINEYALEKINKEESNYLFWHSFGYLLPYYVILTFLVLLVAFVILYYKYGREVDKVEINYVRDIPYDDKPFIVDIIINKGITLNGFLGTFVDLVRRGHIVVEKIENNYVLFSKEDWLLKKSKGKDELSEEEKYFMKILFAKEKNPFDMLFKLFGIKYNYYSSVGSFSEADEVDEITLSKLKMSQKNGYNIFLLWNEYLRKKLNLNAFQNTFFDNRGEILFFAFAFVLVIFNLLFLFFSNVYHFYFLVLPLIFCFLIYTTQTGMSIKKFCAFFILIWILVYTKSLAFGNYEYYFALSIFVICLFISINLYFSGVLSRMQADIFDKYVKWAGLKKFFDDFEYMKDKELESVALWEKYLVYAVVFGNSHTINKEFLKYLNNKRVQSVYSASFLSNLSSFNNAFSSSVGGRGGRGAGGGGGKGAR
ncbi:MAG: DUF2207 domain-containing protein [Candidatus Diapherotrites archaeon]|nr:DUF2207 domain-containing protein [Candidatus Diapherotrites archaeon]